MQITYSNRQRNRDRQAWAFVLGPGDKVESFKGQSIPGKVAVISIDYKKEGKWSHNTYNLEVANAVRFVSGHMGWETGKLPEGLGLPIEERTWVGMAAKLGVSIPTLQSFMRTEFPKNSAALDDSDAALAALPAEAETEEVILTFGSPTNRSIQSGFWRWPLVATSPSGEQVVIPAPSEKDYAWVGYQDQNYSSGDERIAIPSITASRGYHGGSVTVFAILPSGWTLTHQQLF